MTVGSSDDIKEYLNIIDGKFPIKESSDGNTLVSLGVSVGGATPGQTYMFDSGSRWATIIEEGEDHWLIAHGFLEYEADSEEYISKYDMTNMIRSGEMNLMEESLAETDILEESLTLDNEFNMYMDKVDRYLLINEDREATDFDYDWSDAWSEGKTSIEAAEDAILSEV